MNWWIWHFDKLSCRKWKLHDHISCFASIYHVNLICFPSSFIIALQIRNLFYFQILIDIHSSLPNKHAESEGCMTPAVLLLPLILSLLLSALTMHDHLHIFESSHAHMLINCNQEATSTTLNTLENMALNQMTYPSSHHGMWNITEK